MEVQRSRVIQAIARALVAVVGAVSIVALAPAVATAAPAYPIHQCHVTVDPPSQQVHAGGTFRVSGSYYISTHWVVSFNGVTRNFTGTSFTTTFRVPKSTHGETLTLTVNCADNQTQPFQITVLASSAGNGGGHLPNTGGPSIWWLIFAGIAGATGSFLMWRGRRRQIAHVLAGPPEGKHTLRN